MPRIARIVVPGYPHHVTQRGNNRQDVFFVDDDRRVYLSMLGNSLARHGVTVQGYCLMTNHVHLILTPHREDSLAKGLGRAHLLYAQYINRLHARSGHVWQNRYYSCVLDDDHFWSALRYVERNPVRAHMLGIAWEYAWSSATAHTGRGDAAGILAMAQWTDTMPNDEWEHRLKLPEDDELLRTIRKRTHTGRPLANDAFLSKLEVKLGRRLRPLPHGRQRGWRKAT